MTIGDRIKSLRLENDLTLDELGNKIGTSKQTIYKYESGIVTNIPSDKIASMASVFDCSPGYLMGWQESPVVNRVAESPASYNVDCKDSLKHKKAQLVIDAFEHYGLDVEEDSEKILDILKLALDMYSKIKKER